MQSDPIGFCGGENTYSYVKNNSLNKKDPNGLAESCAEEWIKARAICEAQIQLGSNKGITGGFISVEQCARGLVSMRCGGNGI